MTEPTAWQKRQLRAHFGFSQMPFSKYARAHNMFDSKGQRALLQGLLLWSQLRGIACVTGDTGVGKSITLRRLVLELDTARYCVLDVPHVPTSPNGLLRALARTLDVPLRPYTADLFDSVQRHLNGFEEERGPHPLLILDDAEGLTPETLDLLRRLTCAELDAHDRFSLLLTGSDDLLVTLRHPLLASLRSRVGYAQILKPYGLEDTRDYIKHHLLNADCDRQLFADDAIRLLFQASRGRPRAINQLASQLLIEAVIAGREQIDARFARATIAAHPFYAATDEGEAP